MKDLDIVNTKDINNTTIHDPNRHKGWLLEEVAELINPFSEEECDYRLADGELDITIFDPEALAGWLIRNDINRYDEDTNKYGYAVIRDRQGNPYEVHLLTEDVILDFLADSIINLTSYKDIPKGVYVSYE